MFKELDSHQITTLESDCVPLHIYLEFTFIYIYIHVMFQVNLHFVNGISKGSVFSNLEKCF